MQKILTWLGTDPAGSKRYLLPLYMLLGALAYSLVASMALTIFGFMDNVPGPAEGWEILTPWFVVEAFFIASCEELLFRIIPLSIALRIWGVRWPTLLILLTSATLFGLAHGGYTFLIMQGVSGLIFGTLFIKFSKGGTDLVFASAMAIGMHFTFDLSLGLLIALLGGSSF